MENLQLQLDEFYIQKIRNTQPKKKKKLSRKQTREIKHQLLKDGIYAKYHSLRKNLNLIKLDYRISEINDITGEINDKGLSLAYYSISANLERLLRENIGNEPFKHCFQISHNSYKRTSRLKLKTTKMIKSKQCYFVTLTFTDEVMASTTQKTRRDYVRRFLKANCSQYVANIDFGDTTKREHYHGIVDEYISIDKWPYGFSYYLTIRNDEKSLNKLPVYVNKLTNHALKVSTDYFYVIYSRPNKTKGVKR